MRFYAPTNKKLYNHYEIHVYSYHSGNKQGIINYCHKVKQQKGYKNNPNFKWYIVTEEQAWEQQKKLKAWKLEEEKKDLERRFPVRYFGKTAREELAEMMTMR